MNEKEPCKPQTITDFTEEMEKLSGYFNIYWDQKNGKLWLEIDQFDEDLKEAAREAFGEDFEEEQEENDDDEQEEEE